MPLFQETPSTPEEIDLGKPLDLSPDDVMALDEGAWYERAYRGDAVPQLTLRAVVMGAVLGFFLAFVNVYITLKVGWHISVAITACILSFSIWHFFQKIGLAKTPMGILENNCMQSTASAAGYSTGGSVASTIPALLLLSVTPDRPAGENIAWPILAGWTFFVAVLGVTLAIPMKRNLINQEKLQFPSGTAAAVALRSLYSDGAAALRQARALFYAALVSGAMPLLRELNIMSGVDSKGRAIREALLPTFLPIFNFLPGIRGGNRVYSLSDWNIKFDYGPALIGSGAIIGLRVTTSMLAGGLFLVLVLGPMGMSSGWATPEGATVPAVTRPGSAWKELGLWLGAPMLVSAGLCSFALEWRTIARTFKRLRQRADSVAGGVVERIEVPGAWFVVGGLSAGAGLVALAAHAFGIPIYLGVIAVMLTFVLSMVACRVTGETDITPNGPMGKITQLTYGILMPQNVTANLVTAAITSGAAFASSDLLTDLKSGYLLGANPRRQFVAQLLGILPGTVASVIGYYILVPNATALTGEGDRGPAFPAPAAQQWKAVAEVLKLGLDHLHPMARTCIYTGLVVGAVLALLERALPRQKKWFPSVSGFGLGLLLPFNQPLQMFIGAALAALLSAYKGGRHKDLVVPLASGMLAGEGIIGVVVAGINNFVLK